LERKRRISLSDAELRRDQPAVRCAERGIRAAEQAGLDMQGIITSRDAAALSTKDHLPVEDVPEGFQKWQLPFHLDGVSIPYVTVGEPGATVPEHAHEGDSIRIINSGSIIFEGEELTAGDWMYIPAGQSYSYKVSRQTTTPVVVTGLYQC
jgi:hypothetical protein